MASSAMLSLPSVTAPAAREPAHRGRVVLGDEVLGGLGAARRRQARDAAEILVGEGHAVQRPVPAAGRRVGVEGPGRASAPSASTVMKARSGRRGARCASGSPGGLDRRDLARADGGGQPSMVQSLMGAPSPVRAVLERRGEARGLLLESQVGGRALDGRQEIRARRPAWCSARLAPLASLLAVAHDSPSVAAPSAARPGRRLRPPRLSSPSGRASRAARRRPG